MQELTEAELLVTKIIAHGDIYARRDLICALIKYEKITILEQLREKWGEEQWNEIIETC